MLDYVVKAGDDTPNPGKKSELTGTERIQCLDAKTGKQIWIHEYDCDYKLSYPNGPRATPAVDGDCVYTLGAEGNLCCLNVENGNVVWSRDLKKEYNMELAPHWGFAAHPLVDGDTLYCVVGGENSVAVAYDKTTGVEKWRALNAKSPGYCPPTMIDSWRNQTTINLASRIFKQPESGNRRSLLVVQDEAGVRNVNYRPHPSRRLSLCDRSHGIFHPGETRS